jgi:GT2 family glycosyltransferase
MKRPSEQQPTVSQALGHRSNQPVTTLRATIRNRFSRFLAAFREARILQPLHRRYGPIKYKHVLPIYRRLARLLGVDSGGGDDSLSYGLWAEHCEQFRYNRNRALERIERFTLRPTISIILPIYNPALAHLRSAIDSVMNQYYPNWELCICDDASTAAYVQETLKEYSSRDSRVKILRSEINGGIARASNHSLDLATGEFVGLLDHDDELTPDALFEVVKVLQQTEADLIYSDEDRLDSTGRRSRPSLKPAWSPDLLLSCMYLAHFCVYRRSTVLDIGAFREGFDGSQDYELALRFVETTNRIAHIPKILYHWRDVPGSASTAFKRQPAVIEAGRRALSDALRRRRVDGEVRSERAYGYYRVKRTITVPGRVSIIIPTRDQVDYLRRCIASIEEKTNYRDYEILIVDNDSQKENTLEYLKNSQHRVIKCDEPFNFSLLNNLAAQGADGDYLLLLNNDTEVISSEWLSAMIEHAQRPEVGAVGAKLLFPDGRIQHAGIVLGVGGVASHAHRNVDGFSGTGYLNYANVIRNYNAVTGACLMVRRDLFLEVGGFDEQLLPVSFNDVDLCLRLRQKGYLIVYTPYALLYHQESASRGLNEYPNEEARLRARWPSELAADNYYNPNLRLTGQPFTVDSSKPEAMVCTLARETSDETLHRIDNRSCVGQQFLAPENDLCAVAVRFSPALQGDHSVRLHLRETPTGGPDIAVGQIEWVSDEQDGAWSMFSFDPVINSSGKRFYFFIELNGDSAVEALEISGSSITSDPELRLFKNHIAVPGALSFKVYSMKQFRYAAS